MHSQRLLSQTAGQGFKLVMKVLKGKRRLGAQRIDMADTPLAAAFEEQETGRVV